jgi:hypothetical protein
MRFSMKDSEGVARGKVFNGPRLQVENINSARSRPRVGK